MAYCHVKNNINPYSSLYRFIDFFTIQLSLFAWLFARSIPITDTYLLVGLIANVAFSLFAESLHLYRSWRTDFSSRFALCTFSSWIIAIFAVSVFLFFSKSSAEISRFVIGFWFVSSAFFLIAWRIIFRLCLFKRRRQGFNTRKVGIIGLSAAGVGLANEFDHHPETGFTLQGFFDDREDKRLPQKFRDNLNGDIDQGIALARAGHFDVVYIALPLGAHKRIDAILHDLGDTTVDVHLIPDFFTYNLLNARLSHVGSTQTISVYESPLCGLSYLYKRVEDIIGASLILSVIALPMLIISLLIKLDSSGPILFKQKRYGLSGKAITVWKFRSMTVAEDGDRVDQAIKNDPRVTKLGAFLRKTSLDELPQFINVLQGEMSIVGPRPHAVAHNEQYRSLVDFYMLRHKVKPGITGWAQINGWRGETDTLDKMKKRVEFDLHYIRNWSVSFDIKIVCLTMIKGFINRNAY